MIHLDADRYMLEDCLEQIGTLLCGGGTLLGCLAGVLQFCNTLL